MNSVSETTSYIISEGRGDNFSFQNIKKELALGPEKDIITSSSKHNKKETSNQEGTFLSTTDYADKESERVLPPENEGQQRVPGLNNNNQRKVSDSLFYQKLSYHQNQRGVGRELSTTTSPSLIQANQTRPTSNFDMMDSYYHRANNYYSSGHRLGYYQGWCWLLFHFYRI